MAEPPGSSPSSPAPVPELIPFAVPPARLRCAEYCFCVDIDFKKKLKDEHQVPYLLQIITALLNTCGGLIYVSSRSTKLIDHETLGHWKQDLEAKLITFIPRDICQSCIQLLDYSTPLIFVVRKSFKLITLNYYMYTRWLAGTNALSDMRSVKDVLDTPGGHPLVDPFNDVIELQYNSVWNVCEGPGIEHKYWKTAKRVDKGDHRNTYKFRLEDERTKRTIFALPNMPHGGFLVLGIDEDKIVHSNIVKGQIISATDETLLVEYIDKFLRYNSSSGPRIWGQEDGTPRHGAHWTVRFIPITGGPINERRRLIVIHLKHCPFGVFEKCPESYMVSEAGYAVQMAFGEWKQLLNQSMCVKPEPEPVSFSHLTLPSEVGDAQTIAPAASELLSLSSSYSSINSCLASSETETPDPKQQRLTPNTEHTDVGIDHPVTLPHIECFSWTKHRDHWDHNIDGHGIEVEQTVNILARSSRAFRKSTPMTFTPARSTLIQSIPDQGDAIRKAIEHIEHSNVDFDAFAIASSQWASNVLTATQISRPLGHMMDILVASSNCRVQLWSLVEEPCADTQKQWKHAFLSGRVTKRKMLHEHTLLPNCRTVNGLSVECHLFKLHHGEIPSSQTNQPCFTTNLGTTPDFMLPLARTLIERATYIKTIFGDEQSVILTAEQMEVMLSLGLDKFNHIEGPPGCGKTYLAIHLCHKYPCGYIHATATYGAFLKFQGVKHAFLIQTQDDMLDHISNRAFDDLEYLIMDDVQIYDFPKSVWYALFGYITASAVKLIILGDSVYQNYTCDNRVMSREHIQDFCREKGFHPTLKSLSVVHRNNRKIVSFIKSNFEDDSSSPEKANITCSHVEDGDDIEIRCLSNIMSTGEGNSLFHFTKRLVDPKKVLENDLSMYEEKDIAIVVDTVDSERDASYIRKIFRHLLKKATPVHNAGTFPVTGYTIDTLKNFVGFDRRVLILVASNNVMRSNESTGRSALNPRYKTFVASRGISRVVFVVESNLDSSIAARFQLDLSKVPSGSKLIWKTAIPGGITDICSVQMTGQATFICVNKFNAGVIAYSLEGKPVPTSMGTGWMKLECISSSVDGRLVAVAYGSVREAGSWKLAIYALEDWTVTKEVCLPSKPMSLCWTLDGSLLVIIGNEGQRRKLIQVSLSNDKEVWHHRSRNTRLRLPWQIAVSSTNGQIYVTDCTSGCIRELTQDGHHKHDISTRPHTSHPAALCVDSHNQSILVGVRDGSDIYLVNTDGGRLKRVIQAVDRVCSLSLYCDKYLLIATCQGLELHDIEALLNV